MSITVWLPILASIIGLISGGVGAYVGIRVALAGHQVWMDIRDGDIKALEGKVSVHNDDILTLDYEMGAVMELAKIPRARRQRIRD